MSHSRADAICRLRKMQETYRAGLASRIADIRTAANAAVADPNASPDRLLRLSHDLAGSGGVLGLPAVSRAAATVEQIAEDLTKLGGFTDSDVRALEKAIAELQRAAAGESAE